MPDPTDTKQNRIDSLCEDDADPSLSECRACYAELVSDVERQHGLCGTRLGTCDECRRVVPTRTVRVVGYRESDQCCSCLRGGAA